MKKIASLFLLCALLLAGGLTEKAQAQTNVALGPRVGIGLGDFEDPYIGADARIGIVGLPVEINPTFDYYLIDEDNVSAWQITANALFPFGINNQLFTPYAGAGLSVARVSVDIGDNPFGDDSASDTDTALNLVGGAVFQLASFQPFVQAQLTVGGDADLFGVTGGLLFNL